MPEEQAIVIRVKEGGMADVLTERSDACGHCSASACCNTPGGGSNKMVTRALNRAGARAGAAKLYRSSAVWKSSGSA